MSEEWRNIEGYEGYYMISNKGSLKSLDRKVRCRRGFRISKGKIIKTHIGKTGYPFTCLYKNGKYKGFLIHRVVAQAFIDNPCGKKEVNHLDGVKHNNSVSNLEWATRSENATHSYKTGLQKPYNSNRRLTHEQVLTIRSFSIDDISNAKFAELYGIAREAVRDIRRSKTYKDLPPATVKVIGMAGEYQKIKANRKTDRKYNS